MENKETLKEAAVINYKKLYEGEPLTQDVPIDAFIDGAKWQQEQLKDVYLNGYVDGSRAQAKLMYSEEDMRTAFFSAIKSTGEGWNGEYANGNNPNIEEKFTEGFEEWFEQFKKK